MSRIRANILRYLPTYLSVLLGLKDYLRSATSHTSNKVTGRILKSQIFWMFLPGSLLFRGFAGYLVPIFNTSVAALAGWVISQS